MRRAVARAAALAVTLVLAACGERASVAYDGPFAGTVNDVMPRIERLTGMRFKSAPVLRSTARDSVRAMLEQEFERQAAEDLPGTQAAYRILGLIPDTMDLRALMLDFYTEQIAGFYQPRTKTLYVVDGAPRQVRDGIITHELVHALQDQYTDLEALQHIKRDDDRQLAASAVMEGQAQLVTMLMRGQILTRAQIRAAIQQSLTTMPVYAAAPTFVQEMALFPYLSGAEFVQRLRDADSTAIPFGDALPASTEQVMHPAAYDAPRDTPTVVTLPDPSSGATRVYDNDLGEFGTRILLYLYSRSQPEAVSGAAGWDGDRYMVVRTREGDGLAWITIWDSTVDAAEFATVLQKGFERRYDIERTVTAGDGTTTVTTTHRTLMVRGGQLAGRPAVVYVNVPRGVNPEVLPWAGVQLR